MKPKFDPILNRLREDDKSELKERIEIIETKISAIAKTRAIISINFYDTLVEVDWHNLVGADITLKSFATTNISTVYISDGISIVRQDLATLLTSSNVIIANGATLTIEIVKTTDAPAALTIAFE